MTVYLLSILNQVSGTLNFIGFFSLLATFILYLVGYTDVAYNQRYDDDKANIATARKFCRRALMLTAVAAILSSFVPKQEDLIRAYAVTEGAKQINNGNVERIVDAVVNRIEGK